MESSCASSVCFSHVLDEVIGTDDKVRCTRLRFPMIMITKLEEHGFHAHRIGSNADGFCQPCHTDIDTMYVWSRFSVADDTYISPEIQQQKCPLRVMFAPNSSGYAYLAINKTCFDEQTIPIKVFCHDIKPVAIQYRGGILILNTIFINMFRNIFESPTVVGPSFVNIIEGDIDNDNVYAFQCKTWPVVANEWTQRRRKYPWPNYNVITLIKSQGCHFVPVGEYGSPMYSLLWRVSFVLSEKILIRSFNHVQFKVYGLLKLLKSSTLSAYKNDITNESCITSYHIKTTIMWAVENTPKHIWISERLIICFRLCLVYLRHFLKAKYLPNYFLPNGNLFRKLSNINTDSLISKLDMLISNPCAELINIPSLQEPLFLYLDMNDVNSSHFSNWQYIMSKTQMYELFSKWSSHLYIETSVLLKSSFSSDVTSNEYTYALYYMHLIQSMLNTPSVPLSECKQHQNKTVYINTLRRFKHICLRDTQINLSGWLHLATYFYTTQQNTEAKYLCLRFIDSLTPYVHCDGHLANPDDFLKILHSMGTRCNVLKLHDELKYLVASRVKLIKHNCFYPVEIDFEIGNYGYGLIVQIRPLPYAYFLLFICAYHQQESKRRLMSILSQLESMQHNTHYGVDPNNKATLIIFNMIGRCYEMVGIISTASAYYRYALNIKDNPFSEAAELRLQLLLMNIKHI